MNFLYFVYVIRALIIDDEESTVNVKLFEKVSGMSLMEILDHAGRAVFSSQDLMDNGVLHSKISLNDLPTGFYWLQETIDGNIYRTKVAIQ